MGRMVDTLLTGTLGELCITKEEPRDARDYTTPPHRGSHIETMIGRDPAVKSHCSFTCVPIRYIYLFRNLKFLSLFFLI